MIQSRFSNKKSFGRGQWCNVGMKTKYSDQEQERHMNGMSLGSSSNNLIILE
jgi:hypothetical protein